MSKDKLPGFYIEDYDDDELYEKKMSKPGEELKLFLENTYKLKGDKCFDHMDYDMSADGELKDIVFQSALLYILRRLVITAEYIYRSNSENELTTQTKLKEHLKDTTRFSPLQVNEIVKHVMGCLKTARDSFSEGDKNQVKRQMTDYNWNCFICGREMGKSPFLLPSADHLWPRSMGGLSIKSNLRMVCLDCNNNHKKDYIGSVDYHYEQIAMPFVDYEHYQRTNPDKSLEIAIFAKTSYKCDACGQPAYRSGKLTVGRKNIKDGWHYLNLTAYCEAHNPDIK